jgi:hypothetical protein
MPQVLQELDRRGILILARINHTAIAHNQYFPTSIKPAHLSAVGCPESP